MRKGLWILAACGIVGLAIRVGIAEDYFRQDHETVKTPQKRTVQYFSKDGQIGEQTLYVSENGKVLNQTPAKSVTNTAADKDNYYKQLFGKNSVSQNTVETKTVKKSPEKRYKVTQTSANVFNENTQKQFWTKNPGKSEFGFASQANFQQVKGAPKKGAILQTAGEEVFQPFGNTPEPKDEEVLDLTIPNPNLGTPKSNPFIVTPAKNIPAGKTTVQVFGNPQTKPVEKQQIFRPVSKPSTMTSPFGVPQETKKEDSNVAFDPFAPAQNLPVQRKVIQRPPVRTAPPVQNKPVFNFNTPAEKPVVKKEEIPKPTVITPFDATNDSPFKAPNPKLPVAKKVALKPQVATSFANVKTGPQTPSLTLRWEKKSELNVGQPSICHLIVQNDGQADAENVIVDASFPKNVQLSDAAPAPDNADGGLSWTLGTMKIGAQRKIIITMIPSESGDIATFAKVRFTGSSAGKFSVREPKLKIEIQGSDQILVGDPATQRVTISNPGTGVTKNVRLEAAIPKGLEHTKGERLLMEVGSLNPGESRTIRLALAAATGGEHIVQVAAHAAGGLKARASSKINVLSPSLEVAADGPKLRYKGRSATYTLSVKNTGGVATSNVRLLHKVPEGMEFLSNDRGATYDKSSRILTWFVGRMGSGDVSEIKVKLKATDMGLFQHFVRATSEEGSHSDIQISTQVAGIPSLVLKVSDIDDPVEVGEETAYEIKVSNEGSKEAENVGIVCQMPNGIEFIKASGATDHVSELDRVTFRPLQTLAPGKSQSYRVIVRGRAAGSVKFRVSVTSDSTPDSLTSEEQTKFYGQ